MRRRSCWHTSAHPATLHRDHPWRDTRISISCAPTRPPEGRRRSSWPSNRSSSKSKRIIILQIIGHLVGVGANQRANVFVDRAIMCRVKPGLADWGRQSEGAGRRIPSSRDCAQTFSISATGFRERRPACRWPSGFVAHIDALLRAHGRPRAVLLNSAWPRSFELTRVAIRTSP